MVAYRFLAALTIGLTLFACNNEAEKSNDAEEVLAEAVSGAPAVSASDSSAMAQAPSISLTDAKIDSVRLRVKIGDTFRYKVTQVSSSLQDSVDAKSKGVHIYTMRVKKVRSDGSIEVGMTYDSIGMEMNVTKIGTNQQVAKSTFRSSDSADLRNPQNAQYTALLGEEATILFSRQGDVLEISGLTPIVNKLLKSAPPDKQQDPQVKERLRMQVEAAMFSSFVGQQMVPYPQGALDESMSWTRDQTTPIGQIFIVNSRTKYTITDIKSVNDHQVARVAADFSGTIKLGTPPPGATTKLVLNRSKLTGSSKAMLDLNTGMTVSKENHVRMDIAATASDPEFGKSHQMAQIQDTHFTIELLR